VTRAEFLARADAASDQIAGIHARSQQERRQYTQDERVQLVRLMQTVSSAATLRRDDEMRAVLDAPTDTPAPRRRVLPAGVQLDARAWRTLPLQTWNEIVAHAFRAGALATVAVLEGRAIERVHLDVRRLHSGRVHAFGCADDDFSARSARAWYAAAQAPATAGLRGVITDVTDADSRNGEAVLDEAGRWAAWEREQRDAQTMLTMRWRCVLDIAEPLLSGIALPGHEAVVRVARSLSFDERAALRRDRADGWIVP
jgi:hypothetical protein